MAGDACADDEWDVCGAQVQAEWWRWWSMLEWDVKGFVLEEEFVAILVEAMKLHFADKHVAAMNKDPLYTFLLKRDTWGRARLERYARRYWQGMSSDGYPFLKWAPFICGITPFYDDWCPWKSQHYIVKHLQRLRPKLKHMQHYTTVQLAESDREIVKIVAKFGQGWVSENATKALPQAPCLEKKEQAAPLAACKERDHDPRRAVRMRMQTQRQPTDPDAHNPDGLPTLLDDAECALASLLEYRSKHMGRAAYVRVGVGEKDFVDARGDQASTLPSRARAGGAAPPRGKQPALAKRVDRRRASDGAGDAQRTASTSRDGDARADHLNYPRRRASCSDSERGGPASGASGAGGRPTTSARPSRSTPDAGGRHGSQTYRSPTKMPASSLDAYANHADSSSKADMTPGALDALSRPSDPPCHRSDSQTSELRLLESEERTHAQVQESAYSILLFSHPAEDDQPSSDAIHSCDPLAAPPQIRAGSPLLPPTPPSRHTSAAEVRASCAPPGSRAAGGETLSSAGGATPGPLSRVGRRRAADAGQAHAAGSGTAPARLADPDWRTHQWQRAEVGTWMGRGSGSPASTPRDSRSDAGRPPSAEALGYPPADPPTPSCCSSLDSPASTSTPTPRARSSSHRPRAGDTLQSVLANPGGPSVPVGAWASACFRPATVCGVIVHDAGEAAAGVSARAGERGSLSPTGPAPAASQPANSRASRASGVDSPPRSARRASARRVEERRLARPRTARELGRGRRESPAQVRDSRVKEEKEFFQAPFAPGVGVGEREHAEASGSNRQVLCRTQEIDIDAPEQHVDSTSQSLPQISMQSSHAQYARFLEKFAWTARNARSAEKPASRVSANHRGRGRHSGSHKFEDYSEFISHLQSMRTCESAQADRKPPSNPRRRASY